LPDIRKLVNQIGVVNLASKLDSGILVTIGDRCLRDYDIDLNSRAMWEKQNKKALDLAMQTITAKNDPFEGCANVKYPLLTDSAIRFNARAYPEIVQGQNIVKILTFGEDQDGQKEARKKRLEKHLNWQLLYDVEHWDSDTDKLLIIVPITGICFRKVRYCTTEKKAKIELVLPQDLVVNNNVRSLETARRKSHRLWLYANDIFEMQASGLFRDIDLGLPESEQADEDAPHEIIEQHRFLDLDDDGYSEPYVVTFHRVTGQVLRIAANYEEDGIKQVKGKFIGIKPVQYFVDYHFIPSPDGSYYSMGLGRLLEPLNEVVNGTINQLLDAGASQVKGGGLYSKGLKLPGGQVTLGFNEWRQVDCIGNIADHIFPMPRPEVSPVVFELFNAILGGAKDLANLNDIMTDPSKISGNASVPMVMAMMESAVEVFSANYKRIYRGFTKEFRLLFDINRKSLEDTFDYYNLLDYPPEMAQVMAMDYNSEDLAVYPVGDPSLITTAAKASKTLTVSQMSGRPGINEYALTRYILEQLDSEVAKKIIFTEEEMQQQAQSAPPDPLTIAAETEKMKVESTIQLEAMKQMMATQKADYDNAKTVSETIKNLAQAESLEAGQQLEIYKQELGILLEGLKQRGSMIQKGMEINQGAVNTAGNAGMEIPEGNSNIPGNAQGPNAGAIGGGYA
jgi:hypothetical protein